MRSVLALITVAWLGCSPEQLAVPGARRADRAAAPRPTGAAVSLAASSGGGAPPHPGAAPAAVSGCGTTNPGSQPVAGLTASGIDAHTIAPAALAGEGDLIDLRGSVATPGPCDFRWSLTFRAPGGLPVDRTAALSDGSLLQPSFVAAERGTWIARLVPIAGGAPVNAGAAQIEIEVARRDGWVSIGPDGRTHATTGNFPAAAAPGLAGRVNGLAGNGKGLLFATASHGGIWRSDNAADDWYNVSDGRFPPGTGFGRVALSPSGRVYVSTGDPDSGGIFDPLAAGVWASDDGGGSWTRLGGDASCADRTSPTDTVRNLLVDPVDNNTVFVASPDGVYRSSDGGTCWTKIYNGETWDMALAAQPAGQTVLLVATGTANTVGQNVLQSNNPKAAAVQFAPTRSTGTLGGPVLRIVLAGDGKSPLAYAAIVIVITGSDGKPVQQIKTASIDLGVSSPQWRTSAGPSDDCISENQCPYDLSLAADPRRRGVVWLGMVSVYTSTDSALHWKQNNPSLSLHPDHHAILLDQFLTFVGNDGGVQRQLAGGPLPTLWQYANGGMNTTLFYDAVPSTEPDWPEGTVGGLQDNGTLVRDTGRTWMQVSGGDGLYGAFDWRHRNFVYYAYVTGENDNNNVIWKTNQSDPKRPIVIDTNVWWMWSDPFNADALVEMRHDGGKGGQLFYGTQVGSAGAQWSCIDPTPADTTDYISAFEPAHATGFVAGTSTGELYFVPVPSSPSGHPSCASGSATTATMVWSTNGQDGLKSTGPILGISQDPHDALHLILTLGRADAWRVVDLSLGFDGTPTRAIPIAGSGGAGSLPVSANTGITHVALDPIDPGRIYVGTNLGLFEGTRAADGSWQWTQAPDVPAVWITNVQVRHSNAGDQGVVRVSTYGRGVYERVRIAPLSARFHELAVPTANAGLLGVARGADGSVWFAENYLPQLGRVAPNGTVTELPISVSAAAISSGPDGNIWYAGGLQSAARVGRITPDGATSEFALPTSSASPVSIVGGPDGNVWYTADTASNGVLGRVTPQGSITEFVIPDGIFGRALVAGPDGNIWFLSLGWTLGNGGVVRFAIDSHTFSVFPSHHPSFGHDSLAVGADGTLWFVSSDDDGGLVSRMTLDGTITDFQPNPPSLVPVAITSAPDGDLWFTAWDQNSSWKLGAITLGGAMTFLAMPDNIGAFAIGTDAAGNLWFTERSANRIGYFTR